MGLVNGKDSDLINFPLGLIHEIFPPSQCATQRLSLESVIMPSGKPVWPEYWDIEQLLSVKASVALPKWNAQYMQSPTAEEGDIIKRDWWQKWE